MKTKRSLLALLAVLCLLGAACGRDDDATGGEDDDGAPTSSEADAPSGGGGDEEPGAFGTLDEPVCGPGDASGATDQGVTDDAIQVGVLSDADNDFSPGLLQELVDASEAFVAWCNEAGGINGRPIEMVVRDTHIIEAASAVTDACASDFMLVAGGTAFDGSIFQQRVDCGLPEITSFHNADDAVGADLSLTPVARYKGYLDTTMYRLAADQLGDAIEHFGMISYDAVGGQAAFTDVTPPTIAELGYDTVYTANFPTPPATVDNYRPFVEDMSADGVQIFEAIVPPEQMVPVMTTMADAGFTPRAVLGNRSQYSSAMIDGNDGLRDIPTWVESIVYPFEMADENPPTQQFLDIVDAEISGWSGDPKALGVEGFSSWLLWAKAATACGSELTRDCVLEQAARVGEWDGGGITSPHTVTTDDAPASPFCAAVLSATPDGFAYDEEFTAPNQDIWNCDDANQMKIPT